MNVPSDALVLLFPSTSHVLRAEKLLQARGIAVKLVPVPRHLSSDCGICARVGRGDLDRVGEVLAAAGLSWSGPHEAS